MLPEYLIGKSKSTISRWTHNSEVYMLTHSLDNLTLSILIILTVAVYVVVMVVFFIARRKYQGGVIDKVIRYVTAAIGLFLLADITLILALTLSIPWGYSVHIILKILAMTCLTKGGLELFARQP
jgi:hypothetical protein